MNQIEYINEIGIGSVSPCVIADL